MTVDYPCSFPERVIGTSPRGSQKPAHKKLCHIEIKEVASAYWWYISVISSVSHKAIGTCINAPVCEEHLPVIHYLMECSQWTHPKSWIVCLENLWIILV